MKTSADGRSRQGRDGAGTLRVLKAGRGLRFALGFALCFALGAAFSHAAWAQDTAFGAGAGAGAWADAEIAAGVSCKKNEIQYLDRLSYWQIYALHQDSLDANFAAFDKYLEFIDDNSGILYLHFPGGVAGIWYWHDLCWNADVYLNALPLLERDVAWHGLCDVLEALARGYEATVRRTREFVEGGARQRLQNPVTAAGKGLSGEDLQNLAGQYRKLELAFAAAAQELRAEQTRNLEQLPQGVRAAVAAAAPAADISASEAAFLAQVRQKRLAIAEGLDEAVYKLGVIVSSHAAISQAYSYQRHSDCLFLAETCFEAAAARFAADRALPENSGRIIDAAIKSVIPEYLSEIADYFAEEAKFGETLSVEVRRNKEYFLYCLQSVRLDRQARDLVRDMQAYVERQGRQAGQ